jgi:hypothetical protein
MGIAMTQSINQIRDLPHKAVVYGFEGVVSKGFPRKAGTNNLGEWSFETFVVDDADGESIRLSLKNCPEAGWQPGTTIRVEPHKGDKGFSGLYAEDDEYKGVPRRTLLATATSRRTIIHAEQAPQRAAAQAPQQRTEAYHNGASVGYKPPPEYAEDAPEQPKKPTERPAKTPQELKEEKKKKKEKTLSQVRALAFHSGQAWGLCFDAAVHQLVHVRERHGVAFHADHQFRLAMAIFINAKDAMSSGQFGSGAKNIADLPMDFEKKPVVFSGQQLSTEAAAFEKMLGEYAKGSDFEG